MALLPLVQQVQPYVTDLFGSSHYLAAFTVLLLCGVGLPLPEEVTLIYSGILVHQGKADWASITLVCSAAILLGDSIPYWLGRRFGTRALRVRWVARILHPERFALLERRFARHGSWAVFTCRFLPGLRIPGYFTAGTLKMSYPRFFLLDLLGVALSVPISIKLGEIFGGSIETLHQRFKDLHLLLAFILLSIILILIVRARGARRAQEAAEPLEPTSSLAPEIPDSDDSPFPQTEPRRPAEPASRPEPPAHSPHSLRPPSPLPPNPAAASRQRPS